jgi:hypothetical protein
MSVLLKAPAILKKSIGGIGFFFSEKKKFAMSEFCSLN